MLPQSLITVGAVALATLASAKPLPAFQELVARRKSHGHSFNKYNGWDFMSGFDDFYGVDNFSGSSLTIVQEKEVVCKSQPIVVIQQHLAVLQEYYKKVLTTQICKVEAQVIVHNQFISGCESFSKDLRRNGKHKEVTFDVEIAAKISQIHNKGECVIKDWGWKGDVIGKHSCKYSGDNWDPKYSPAKVSKAYDDCQQAYIYSSPWYKKYYQDYKGYKNSYDTYSAPSYTTYDPPKYSEPAEYHTTVESHYTYEAPPSYTTAYNYGGDNSYGYDKSSYGYDKSSYGYDKSSYGYDKSYDDKSSYGYDKSSYGYDKSYDDKSSYGYDKSSYDASSYGYDKSYDDKSYGYDKSSSYGYGYDKPSYDKSSSGYGYEKPSYEQPSYGSGYAPEVSVSPPSNVTECVESCDVAPSVDSVPSPVASTADIPLASATDSADVASAPVASATVDSAAAASSVAALNGSSD